MRIRYSLGNIIRFKIFGKYPRRCKMVIGKISKTRMTSRLKKIS
jgi:hypothetical protein